MNTRRLAILRIQLAAVWLAPVFDDREAGRIAREIEQILRSAGHPARYDARTGELNLAQLANMRERLDRIRHTRWQKAGTANEARE